jgi:EAL domain-containing protein (putative c-di-GMP-specific phosphodiesterase class I)
MGNGSKEESMIVRTIMPLAHNLGLDVVAEGVETNEQVALLKELRCKYAQGFYFSRPINAEEAQMLLLTKGFEKQKQEQPVGAVEPAF